jgi:hypothetical protein
MVSRDRHFCIEFFGTAVRVRCLTMVDNSKPLKTFLFSRLVAEFCSLICVCVCGAENNNIKNGDNSTMFLFTHVRGRTFRSLPL